MKIAEVRSLLDGYTKKQLAVLVTDMYKSIPKAVKEEKGIDALIQNAGKPKSAVKKKKVVELPNLDDLIWDIDEFVENAYKQNYFAPNREVSKKERSRWRFKVKQFYKDLILCATIEENRSDVADSIEKLYKVLCKACGCYLFSSDTPFDSIGISQADFLRSLLAVKKEVKPADEFLSQSCMLIVTENTHHDTGTMTLFNEVLTFCTTPDLREMLFDACLSVYGVVKQSRRAKSYEKERRLKNLTKMGFIALAELREFTRAISFFKEYFPEQRNDEFTLYCLLRLLYQYSRKDLFIQEFESAVVHNISPRESLYQAYEHLESTNEFPDRF